MLSSSPDDGCSASSRNGSRPSPNPIVRAAPAAIAAHLRNKKRHGVVPVEQAGDEGEVGLLQQFWCQVHICRQRDVDPVRPAGHRRVNELALVQSQRLGRALWLWADRMQPPRVHRQGPACRFSACLMFWLQQQREALQAGAVLPAAQQQERERGQAQQEREQSRERRGALPRPPELRQRATAAVSLPLPDPCCRRCCRCCTLRHLASQPAPAHRSLQGHRAAACRRAATPPLTTQPNVI